MNSSEKFTDDFNGKGMANIAYGRIISDYGKFIILECLIYYVQNKSPADETNFQKLKSVINNLLTSDLSIENAWKQTLEKLEIETPEGLIALAIDIFKPERNDLLNRLMLTYGKIKGLSRLEEWFNNFKLNGLSNGINMVIWDDKLSDDSYGVGRIPEPINEKIELHNYDRYLEFLVGELRAFIIENNFYQNKDEKYKLIKPKFKTVSSKEICDKCYNHYCFYYFGSHGANFYEFPVLSLNIKELSLFSQRYPSAILGGIINTLKYGTGGQHWTSLTIKNRKAFLICSAGGSFENFQDNGELKNQLMKHGFSLQYNPRRIQTSTHECGMYSFLSNYVMLCTDCDLDKTVQLIGEDSENLVSGKNIFDFIRKLALDE